MYTLNLHIKENTTFQTARIPTVCECPFCLQGGYSTSAKLRTSLSQLALMSLGDFAEVVYAVFFYTSSLSGHYVVFPYDQ